MEETTSQPLRRSRKALVAVGLVALFTACNPMRGCAASEFELAPDSRLPRWMQRPSGYQRADVTVRIAFYTPPVDVENVVAEMFHSHGKRLDRQTGRFFQFPGDTPVGRFPRWSIVVINGVMEVLEFRRLDSLYYVTDDKTLIDRATVAVSRPRQTPLK